MLAAQKAFAKNKPPPLFGAQSVGVEDEAEEVEGVALEEILEGKLIIISPYMH